MAVSLVEALTTQWDPKNYRDTYTARVQKLIEAKKENREVVAPQTSDEAEGKVLDLLAALESSVEAAKKHKPGNTHDVPRLRTQKTEDDGEKRPAKKSGVRKSAAKKAGSQKARSGRKAS